MASDIIVKVEDINGNIRNIFPTKVSAKISENASTEITMVFDNTQGLNTNLLRYGDIITITVNL